MKRAVVRQNRFRIVAGKFSDIESGKTAVVTADPERYVSIFVKRAHGAARQAVRCLPACKFAVFVMRQAAVSSNPQPARSCFDDRFHVVSGESVIGCKTLQNAVFETP